ncbi:MAG: hypothetical protein CR997_09440 [Acidobacteria bacterium]|nr:MAG: hypothetical protein CR997_09440 [Acidobacteriota bacterium]
MISSELYNIKNALSKDGIGFFYAGVFSPGVLSEALSILGSKRKHRDFFPKEIFSIFLEQTRCMVESQDHMQQDRKLFGANTGLVFVSEKNDQPVLILGMEVPEDRAAYLKVELDHILSGKRERHAQDQVGYAALLSAVKKTRDSMTFEFFPRSNGMAFVSLSFFL